MEVKRQMKIPADIFYKKIIDSVLYDIHSVTGKIVNEKQLKDFEYVKKFSRNISAKIKIEEAETNSIYRFRTSTTKNDFVTEYTIIPVNDETCQLVYKESMVSYGLFQRLNDLLIGSLMTFFKKRHFKKMLQMMEESY
ncbi:DUF3284 domain-containing protein [Enterococcus sp. LJL120]|uniref:DUF3284 domain-containing protein n=1 Tax=Enterococcus sp. HY326 TaxID=2971265 RepID=UPI00223F4535|nr:DUF3284 domain-containing protein [Enterococcus sp. HY326]